MCHYWRGPFGYMLSGETAISDFHASAGRSPVEGGSGVKSGGYARVGSMSECDAEFEAALIALNEVVEEAAEFFRQAAPDLFDGHQTAADVISHLVFWHGEYVSILHSLRNNIPPELSAGTFNELNAAAAERYCDIPLDELVCQLLALQSAFDRELRLVPDLSAEIPVKQGGRIKSVRDRVPTIEAHIRNHLRRLRSAQRHGKEWVKAYYRKAPPL